jgi:hypothetical protein
MKSLSLSPEISTNTNKVYYTNTTQTNNERTLFTQKITTHVGPNLYIHAQFHGCYFKNKILSEQKLSLTQKLSLHGTSTKSSILNVVCTTGVKLADVQAGLTDSARIMWVAYLHFPNALLGSICRTFASFQHIL